MIQHEAEAKHVSTKSGKHAQPTLNKEEEDYDTIQTYDRTSPSISQLLPKQPQFRLMAAKDLPDCTCSGNLHTSNEKRESFGPDGTPRYAEWAEFEDISPPNVHT